MLAHFILNPSQLFLLSIDVVNLVIGICVFLKNPERIVNRTFFIFVFGAFAWSSGISLLYISHDFIFDKLILGGGLVMLFGLTLFARVFPGETRILPKFYILFIPLFLAAVFLPCNLFIKGILIDKEGLVQPINGPLFPFYVVVTILYVGVSIYFFIKSFKSSLGNPRMQMLYFSTGITVFIASLAVCNVILPSFGIYQFNLVGPAASFIFMCLTSYAILRHQLMDIRVVIQRGTIYSLLLSMIILCYISAIYVTSTIFKENEKIADPILDSVLMIFGIVTIPRIERYFRKITDRFFFKDHYEYTSALEKLSTILNTNMGMKAMVMQLMFSLDRILHPKALEYFHLSNQTLYDLSGQERIHIALAEIPEDRMQISVISEQGIIGTFRLGEKKSGDPYTQEDLTLLRTFSAQAAVAFEKAEFYRQLQEYSKSLEEKIQARTQKLEQMRTDQRQLFDDISHALQTPLTVLKGAMELAKFEEASNKIRSGEIIERSIDDMSRLIREIMQLARFDALPEESEACIFNLSYLTENVIEYVEVICAQADIQIRSQLSPDLMVLGNEKEIEEVLTNLLSNAIHYTAGSTVREIHLTLTELNESIELRIRDTGVGISNDKLPNIFERFYRSTEHNTAKKIGYGLGLAIVKRNVERHGGKITVESTLEYGTTFIMNFKPAAPQSIVVPESKPQA